jgi:exopolyphosphatase / guanosine-5'-triphosphate,3'-diphosphate pyrophosphatase
VKAAIIDLGTNTFNILIIEIEKGKEFEVLLNTKSAVMLGSEGLLTGYLSDKAFTRAYAILRDFSNLINEFKCEKVVAFGTSAIRDARNSEAFINKVARDFNIQISPITGLQEAQYIYRGVLRAVPFTAQNYLILDIGGGSNEFIIANQKELHWKNSYPLGGARLIEMFKPGDPITQAEIQKLYEHFDSKLDSLFESLDKFPVTKLVGSSGAFDSFADMVYQKKHKVPLPPTSKYSEFSIEEFMEIYKQITTLSRNQRLLIPGLEALRVDTIVLSSVFTRYVIEKTGVTSIIQSDYSLKEGVAAQIENNL